MAKASTSKGAKRALPRAALSKEQKVEIYRYMLLTRRVEERLVNLYRQNAVVGGLYRSLGQEAETIASVYALEPQDPIGPLIRNMGSLFLRGYSPRDVIMQYMARSGGPTGGKDLNVHFGTVPDPGVVPPISMLGDLIPVMAGVALAARMRGEDRVALTYIGDGGTSTGAFYEGMNLAAVWRLPLIVVVENNGYAYSTPTANQMAVDTIAEKGKGLGVHSVTIDGNDALAVYDAVFQARQRGARGEGPTLVEAMTYRRKGHAEHDMQKYVPEGEIEQWEKNDPVDRFHEALVAGGRFNSRSFGCSRSGNSCLG
jgi:TPP-dependent pyruvate/acetoin dehydrogenase alpha subunit